MNRNLLDITHRTLYTPNIFHIRLALVGSEAMAGITVIGLSTAILFAVIQRSCKISQRKAS